MKSYVTKLSARGFNKEKKVALVEAGAAFKKAFSARSKERGEARAESLARESTFRQLRTEPSYFRLLGNEALGHTMARADFDRVKPPTRPSVVTLVPPPATPLTAISSS